LKLHLLKCCPFCSRVLFVVQLGKIDVEIVWHYGYDTLKTPEYLAINPNGQAPTLETEEGPIYESVPIIRYLARVNPELGLYGHTNYQAGIIDQWILNINNLSGGVLKQWIRFVGKYPFDGKLIAEAKQQFTDKVKRFEDHLALRTYLVGDQVTIADCILLSILIPAFTGVYTKKQRSAFKNLSRYFDHLTSLPFFTGLFGNVRTLTKNFKYPPVPQTEEQKEAKKGGKKK